MSENLINLIRDRFDGLENKIDTLHQDVKEHVTEDKKYWKKLDEQEGQLRLIKWVSGSGVITGIGGAAVWFYKKLLS